MCPPRALSHLHVLLRGVAPGSPTIHDCVICQDPIRGAEIRAPCGHYYGIDYVTDLFQSATRDETLFPPRCCRQNIPFAWVQPHLSQALVTTFQQKQVEFSTLKRVYCSSPTCSRFLGPLSEGISRSKVYTCPAPGCERRTCAKCREQHNGDWMHACRPDADANQVLELGRASGWARCPGCSQMIELNMGCFHMTCRCRTEFCYLCRARWKTCPCPQWDERRLLAAAEERVDAQLGVGQEQAGVRPLVPAPVPARRRVPPPLPPRHLAPARPPAVEIRLPQPTHPRSSTSLTGRPANTVSTRPKEGTNHELRRSRSAHPAFVPTRTLKRTATSSSLLASASTSTSKPSVVRPKCIHNPDATRQRLVREMMERMRVDHDCDHGGWRYRRGGGICQSCGHHLPLYLFVSDRAVVRASCSRRRSFSVARAVKCWRAGGARITVCETRQRFEIEWQDQAWGYAFRSALF